MANAATLKFEMGPCSRCGGSGHFSSCQRFGTVCFKCAGRKIAPTRRGAKAIAAIREFKAAQFSVAVENLQPGDRYAYDGRTVTVASVATSGGSRYGWTNPATGVQEWRDYITVEFAAPVKTDFGPVSSHCYIPGMTVVRAVSGADWDQVVAFARTLKGVDVIEPVLEPAPAVGR